MILIVYCHPYNRSFNHAELDAVKENLHRRSLKYEVIDLYKDEIKDIRNALQKIKDGTFGVCEMCDDEIDVERLKVKPHAKYCINCRELFEQTQKKER